MPKFCVNKNVQPNGDHEVHQYNNNCPKFPNPENRLDLGEFPDCRGAVALAKLTYPQSNGCYYCANQCHTQ